jgi:tetratricopeptide (TPR) repeat protein
MNLKYILILIVLLGFQNTAKASFSFNSRCMEAYKALLSLKLNDARQLIREEKKQNPDNGITILLDNYVDYFGLLASDNKAEYTKWKELRSDRLDALADNEDQNSPYYLFAQAEVYLQWGLLKGKFGDYTSSAIDLKKARGLLNDNVKKYPDFLPNQKNLALINVVFGSIPSNLRSVANFFGMKGNAQAGINQLEKVRAALPGSKYNYYDDEVVFFLCIMYIDVLHNTDHYSKLNSYIAAMDDNSLLKSYLQGYVAFKCGHNNEAITYLQRAPQTSAYAPMPVVTYLLGNAKLCRMDSDAYVYYLRYLQQYKGASLIKDSYLKLAYYYFFKNDMAHYNSYIKLVRSAGSTVNERDKQALKEANDAPPDLELLRARFLYDGGYYEKALNALKGQQINDLKLLRDRIEMYYRLGRIKEKLNDTNDAIAYYQKAMAIGKSTPYYYSANSALTLGNIYEQRKDKARAGSYYKQALAMKNHEYQNSIDTQAKEGLERLGLED